MNQSLILYYANIEVYLLNHEDHKTILHMYIG